MATNVVHIVADGTDRCPLCRASMIDVTVHGGKQNFLCLNGHRFTGAAERCEAEDPPAGGRLFQRLLDWMTSD